MPYDNNVPQATQQIAATQLPINNNFAFIQTDAQVDHIFNGNTPWGTQAEGTHQQASMSNRTDPVSLPTGVSGIFYVNAHNAKFYNGTSPLFLAVGSTQQITLSGSVTLSSAGFTTIFTSPAYTAGTIYIIGPSATVTGSVTQFISSSTNVNFINPTSTGLGFSIVYQNSGLVVSAKSNTGSIPYKYVVVYNTP